VFFAAHGLSSNRFFSKQFAHYNVVSSPVRKNLFAFVYIMLKGFVQAKRLIKKKKVDLVIGFGSFHSFPVLLAALWLKIPLVLFESNTIMGRVNRLFAKRAKLILSQLHIENYHYDNLYLIRPEITDKLPKASSQEKGQAAINVLIFGGSQGAKKISQLLYRALQQMDHSNLHLIHITGPFDEASSYSSYYKEKNISAEVITYVDNMDTYYKRADIAICRSGALSILELIRYHIPAILIPFARSMENHQWYNAHFFQTTVQGGYLHQEVESDELFIQKFLNLLNNEKREQKKQNLAYHDISQQTKPTALQLIDQLLKEL